MTILPFREYHILSLLSGYDQQHLPLDLFISLYFRANKSLGSKDRGEIADTVYTLVRWNGLLDYLCKDERTWERKLEWLVHGNLEKFRTDESIPLHIRLSFPQELFQLIANSHGTEKAIELCLESNKTAPTTVRINALKATREEMLTRWTPTYDISPCQHASESIVFNKKINFFGLPEFQEGFFEVQDEGSQLIAHLVKPTAGQQVIDYCSGSGGKTLAFAPSMQNSGQIFLHDIRPRALQEARKRLRRAGIQNAQTIAADSPHLKKLKKKMDWVLADVPCSGTGTLRRNPDMKWKFTEEMFRRLVGEQRLIFERALSYLHPKGKIVYATCSILKEENQDQVAHFLKTYQLKIEGEIFQSLPASGEMDGFFGVVLTR